MKTRIRRNPALLGLGFAALLVLAGCSEGFEELFSQENALVWTDSESLPLAAEQFNRQNSGGKVRLLPESVLTSAQDFQKSAGTIGNSMLTAAQLRGLSSLDEILVRLGRSTEDYPENSFDRAPNGAIIGFPLSVDPALVIFARSPGDGPQAGEGESAVQAWLMDVDELIERARSFTRKNGDSIERLGYNPAWDSRFIQTFLLARGANFRDAPDTSEGLLWDQAALLAAVIELRNWFGEIQISSKSLNQFDENYGYDTWYNLLRLRRVLFRVIPFSEYQALEAEYRDQLQFRWLTFDGRVHLSGPAISAYAASGKNSADTVIDFISWVSSEEGIHSVLETRWETGLSGLLYLEGYPLSSDRENAWQQEFYPNLVFPPNHLLRLSQRLPSAWDRLFEEVILPWVKQAMAAASEDEISGGDLAQRLSSWQLLYGH